MANLFGTELAAGAQAGAEAYTQSLHDHLVNTIAQQDQELKVREAALRDREEARLEAESQLRAHEAERTDIEKERDTSYIKGDYFDPGFVARAKKAGVPLAVQPQTPEDAISTMGATAAPGVPVAPPKPMPLRFAGAPKERLADQEQQKVLDYVKANPNMDPRVKQSLEYEAMTGKNPPAAMEASTTEPVFRVSPLDKKKIEQFTNGAWAPYMGSEIPKGARVLQETNPPPPPTIVLPGGTFDKPTVSVVPKKAGATYDARAPRPAPPIGKLNAEQRLAYQATLKLMGEQFKGIFGVDPTPDNIDAMQQQAYDQALKVGSGPVLDFNTLK